MADYAGACHRARMRINVIASEAKQSSFLWAAAWIASSQALLAMTLMDWCIRRLASPAARSIACEIGLA
jgi:hypothetical protein